jgi:8-oxo-dGTP diphosphatase
VVYFSAYYTRKAGFPTLKQVKHQVFAYITHRNRLLVFIHPFAPEAGIQVPAGTVKANERPEEAVLREAFEETGLSDLIVDGFLGEHERDMSDFGRDEIHHRRFYHLRCEGDPPVTWRHEERDSSDDPKQVPIIFEFFWAPLPHEVPPLIADHGKMLPLLFAKLS